MRAAWGWDPELAVRLPARGPGLHRILGTGGTFSDPQVCQRLDEWECGALMIASSVVLPNVMLTALNP